MNAATLSFRAPLDFAAQTKALASALKMSSSDYVREAVREKNERAIRQRPDAAARSETFALLSTLSVRLLALNGKPMKSVALP